MLLKCSSKQRALISANREREITNGKGKINRSDSKVSI